MCLVWREDCRRTDTDCSRGSRRRSPLVKNVQMSKTLQTVCDLERFHLFRSVTGLFANATGHHSNRQVALFDRSRGQFSRIDAATARRVAQFRRVRITLSAFVGRPPDAAAALPQNGGQDDWRARALHRLRLR
jgi:hypothetical protein